MRRFPQATRRANRAAYRNSLLGGYRRNPQFFRSDFHHDPHYSSGGCHRSTFRYSPMDYLLFSRPATRINPLVQPQRAPNVFTANRLPTFADVFRQTTNATADATRWAQAESARRAAASRSSGRSGGGGGRSSGGFGGGGFSGGGGGGGRW
uniref:Uncharacterized protein n=1 Tax=Chromera velia CCMP2878 TaxID=1169474 RepID=A0A0G4I6J4_9ALVE|eukprot:Cvel_36361.t1-p1 / transcript=Cvel_36361.t1 / gene=Cvel_36361 / organism=Chromera_velia_CCMP2878 / gene_product=hypothetical protein / transcript_product=hypothetical protein / location=Cvel_scaffold7175:8-653(+) / protein_length=150 / sequence_SO=supercontig / SO=protein_coding / is_pseudo=false